MKVKGRKKKNRKCNGNHVSSIHPDPTHKVPLPDVTVHPTPNNAHPSNLQSYEPHVSRRHARPSARLVISSQDNLTTPQAHPNHANGVNSLFISLTSGSR
jgi:hypothetical protein